MRAWFDVYLTKRGTVAYLPCPKLMILTKNIKIALMLVMKRDYKNHTPTLDTEPQKAPKREL